MGSNKTMFEFIKDLFHSHDWEVIAQMPCRVRNGNFGEDWIKAVAELERCKVCGKERAFIVTAGDSTPMEVSYFKYEYNKEEEACSIK